MNNKNKILVGCLALLLVLSVGYALFSDTITINGTATAKGSFDMTATCETGISSKLGTAESLGLEAEGGYENDTCTVVDDVVTASVNFKYPGARRYYTVKLTNTGSIDVAFNEGEDTKNATFCYSTDLNDDEPSNCENFSGGGVSIGAYSGYAKQYFYGFSDENDNMISQDAMDEYYDLEKNIITLPPNHSAYMVFEYSINAFEYSISNEENTGVLNAKLTSTYHFPFTQAQ